MTTTAAAPVTTDALWQIDPAHSSVEFSIRHLMITTVRGRFGKLVGNVRGIEGLPVLPAVDVTIEAASIDTGIAQRDEHLRSADFFDVATFPTVAFRSSRIEGSLDGDFTLVGDLTIKGTTREVAVAVESQGQTLDPWGNQRAGFSGTGKLNRSDFGLTYNQVLEAGGLALGDEIKFTIDVALIRPVVTGS